MRSRQQRSGRSAAQLVLSLVEDIKIGDEATAMNIRFYIDPKTGRN